MTRWFFVHLMKTGGTSLFFMLQRQFQRTDIFPPAENADQLAIDSSAAIEEIRNTSSPYKLVSGHYPYSSIEDAPGDWKTFTLLRHPVHRTLSSLKRQRDRAEGESAESIYSDPIRHGMSFDNYMVKVLGSTPEDRVGDLFRCEQRHLDRALAALDDIDVIGVSEDFAPFVRRLEDTFGWNLGEPLEVNRTAEFDVPDALIERVWEDNKFDLQLYARALELLELPSLEDNPRPVATPAP